MFQGAGREGIQGRSRSHRPRPPQESSEVTGILRGRCSKVFPHLLQLQHLGASFVHSSNLVVRLPFRMLVYEYLDNGNLEQWLHGDVGPSSPLTWDIRMNIMLGTAKGYQKSLNFFGHSTVCRFILRHKLWKLQATVLA